MRDGGRGTVLQVEIFCPLFHFIVMRERDIDSKVWRSVRVRACACACAHVCVCVRARVNVFVYK